MLLHILVILGGGVVVVMVVVILVVVLNIAVLVTVHVVVVTAAVVIVVGAPHKIRYANLIGTTCVRLMEYLHPISSARWLKTATSVVVIAIADAAAAAAAAGSDHLQTIGTDIWTLDASARGSILPLQLQLLNEITSSWSLYTKS